MCFRFTTSRNRTGVLLVALLTVAAGMLASASVVQAASWNIRSQGSCASGTPTGDSWLNWEGYNWWDSGSTSATLWQAVGGRWVSKSSGFREAQGGTNNAMVTNKVNFAPASYVQNAVHKAVFFSGTKNSESNVFTCR